MITHVAIKSQSGAIFSLQKPNRHGDILKKYPHVSNGILGFLKDNSIFLNRIEACKHAIECQQILPPYNPLNPSQRRWDLNPDLTIRQLFSEDVW